MMIELTAEVNRAFSAGDLGLLKSWGAARLRRATNECAPNGALHRLFNRATIDRRAAPSLDEFPKLSISLG
jgi:hypothetical protein